MSPVRTVPAALVMMTASLAALTAACGEANRGGKPYSFSRPAGFHDVEPGEYGSVLGDLGEEHVSLLRPSGPGEALDFVRIYTVREADRSAPQPDEIVRQAAPLMRKVNTRILANHSLRVAARDAVQLRLRPAPMLGTPVRSLLTVLSDGHTAYFVQCQWKQRRVDERRVGSACKHVLDTLRLD